MRTLASTFRLAVLRCVCELRDRPSATVLKRIIKRSQEVPAREGGFLYKTSGAKAETSQI